nr:MAG TPA: hypothetical protein [Caudoviricetes sp.]
MGKNLGIKNSAPVGVEGRYADNQSRLWRANV